MNDMIELQSFFEQVNVINLQRRADRMVQFEDHMTRASWPFKVPERIEAIDGLRCPFPSWWKQGRGAWGCYRTHLNIIEKCLTGDIRSVLILEDDAVPVDNFVEKVSAFLKSVPDDWDMIYLGGQHLLKHHQPPVKINERVIKVFNVNRTHAYAIHNKMLPVLYQHLLPHQWPAGRHIDHHFGQLHQLGKHKIYAPCEWLVGQSDGLSDISGRNNSQRFWNENKSPSLMNSRTTADFVLVLGLACSGSSCVAGILHHLGVHLGNQFVNNRNVIPYPTYEAIRLHDICRRLIPVRPTESLSISEKAVSEIENWILKRKREARHRGTIAGCKHPLLCKLGDVINGVSGGGLKVISVERPIEESIASLFRKLSKFCSHEQATNYQKWLMQGKEEFLRSNVSHLRVRFSDILASPENTVQQIVGFLGIQPEPVNVEKAVRSICIDRLSEKTTECANT